jgi:hypothetical protein
MNIFGQRRFSLTPEKPFISAHQKDELCEYLKSLDAQHQLLDSLHIANTTGNLLVFSSLTRPDLAMTRLGFMSAGLTQLIVNLIDTYRKQEFTSLTIETSQRIVSSSLLRFPKGDAMLLCVFRPGVQLGLALRNVQFHKKNLSTILLTDR